MHGTYHVEGALHDECRTFMWADRHTHNAYYCIIIGYLVFRGISRPIHIAIVCNIYYPRVPIGESNKHRVSMGLLRISNVYEDTM